MHRPDFHESTKLIVKSGMHPSFHDNCQHQINFANVSLRVEYPPPYKRRIWDYTKADVDGINKAISQFNWQESFINLTVNNCSTPP